MDIRLTRLARLIQFSDATFPVGTFSFSNGLETAAYEKIVTDAESLREFTIAATRQAAFTDGIAALHAFRAAKEGDFAQIVEADHILMASKMNHEARLMLRRMGKKFAELAVKIFPQEISERWLEAIEKEQTPGSYPVSQGVAFATSDLSEEDLFASHQYGVANMILGAALRLVRVSHYDTQKILYELTDSIPEMYDLVKGLSIFEMNCFVLEMDICASLHEKGNMRMFMS